MVKWRRGRGLATPLARAVLCAIDCREVRPLRSVCLSDLRDGTTRFELEVACCWHHKAHGTVGLRGLDIPGNVS